MTKHAIELVSALDSEYGLLDRLSVDRGRTYDFGDILMARYASRATAGRAIGRGRLLEDAVEGAVRQVGLPHQMRTSFVGQVGMSKLKGTRGAVLPKEEVTPSSGDEKKIGEGKGKKKKAE